MKRILVVDDYRTIHTFIKKSLDLYMEGTIEVDFAENGLVALQKVIAGNRYNLIFMDIKMPVMNGLQAAVEIKKRVNVPIIAHTAMGMDEVKIAMRKRYINGCVRKPSAIEDFLTHLTRYNLYPMQAKALEDEFV